MQNTMIKRLSLVSLGLTLTCCQQQPSQGTLAGPVSGSVSGSTSFGADSGLTRCPETLGTLAIDDGREDYWWGPFVQATQITTIEPMVRLVVQQSNCFIITSIGNNSLNRRMNAITNEQRNSGEFRPGSSQQKGQRVAADYFMEPAILFSNSDIGGIAGAAGSLLGSYGRALSVLGGAYRQSGTSVTMSLFDIRAGAQVAASEGSSTASNFGALIGGLGGGSGGVLGGYSRTPAGQATVAAFVDAYNKMVVGLRSYKAQTIRGGAGTGGLLRIQ